MKMTRVYNEDETSDYTVGNCDKCGTEIRRYRGEGDLFCSGHCGAIYNCFGQRLRDDLLTRPNRSEWDEDCGDMEGYEEAMTRGEE